MNHTYRLVWNRALSMFVAVSECARAMGKSAGGKALAGAALAAAVLAAPASYAHTTSVGYEVKPNNTVQIWYGTYHNTAFTEGSLSFIGDNGYTQTVSFTDLVTARPVGLVDGTTNFFSDGISLIGTANRSIYTWQGVTFQNLRAGTYTFNYLPIAQPTADWQPIDNVIRTGSFVLTAEALAAGGGNNTIDTQATSYDASLLPATGTLAFEGGTLKNDTNNATLGQDFTIDTKGGTLDQAGNTSTYTGSFADAAGGVPGTLNVANSGNGGQVVLAGTNTYTGATTIAQGATLALGGNGSIAASSGVTNEGTLVIGSDAPASIAAIAGSGAVQLEHQNLVLTRAAGNYGGVIAGNGDVTVAGGTQQLSGINSFAGTVRATSGGTVRVAADANLGAAGNAVVLDGGTLSAADSFTMTRALAVSGRSGVQVDANATLVANGAASGSGNLVKEGAGTLVLGGDNSAMSGDVHVNGGTLALASKSSAGTGAVNLNAGTLQGAVSLTLAQSLGVAAGTTIDTVAGSTMTLAGGVNALGNGDACFTKSGSGTLNIASAGTFGSGVCVTQGELRANGLIGSTFVTVFEGATLRGSGAISAPVTVRGTLAPGNSPGTLSTSQTVTMDAGATFQADINGTGTASGPGNYSRLLVTGAGQFVAGGATLAPNLVHITGTDTYTPYVPKVGESFRIVSAAGGVVGRFGTLLQPQGLAADTRMAVFYDGNGTSSIDLRVLPGSYARFAAAHQGNLNAQQSGAMADRLLAADQAGTATAAQSGVAYALSGMSGERLGSAVGGLSGEVHAALAAAAPLAGQSLQRSVQGQLAGVPAAGTALWADLSGNRTRWSADDTASAFHADRGQLTVGVDAFRNGASRIGVGFAHGRSDLDAAAGSGKLRENMLFAYGAQQGERLTLDAMAGIGRSTWSTERANPLAAGQLHSSADGRSALASVGVSLPWQVQGVPVAPFVRVLWQRVERDAAGEGVDAAALSLGEFSAHGLRTTVGVAGTVKRADAASLRYSVAAGRDSGSLLRPVVGVELAGLSTFVAAPQADRGFVEASLSGTVAHSAKTSSFYGVSTELRGGRTDVSLSGGLRYSF
jgi:fibronectin-binding autotransporter adhesin